MGLLLKTVPFGNVAYIQTETTSGVGRSGNEKLVTVKKAMMKEDFASGETTSKYHHCQTGAIIETTFGASTPVALEMKSTWLVPGDTVLGTMSTKMSLGRLGADAARAKVTARINGENIITDLGVLLKKRKMYANVAQGSIVIDVQ